MSAPGNAAKLGTTQEQYTDSIKFAIPGCDRTYNALVSLLLSQRINPPCQPECSTELIYQASSEQTQLFTTTMSEINVFKQRFFLPFFLEPFFIKLIANKKS